MPSITIDVCRTYRPDEEPALLQAAHQCLVDALGVAPAHRNVLLQVHAPQRFLGRPGLPPGDPWLTRVTVCLRPGRPRAAKRRFYALLVQRLASFGIPPDRVLVRLIEQPAENFGVRGGQALCDLEPDGPGA